jgi:hypothetical protein
LSNRPSKQRSSSARVQAAARANKSSNTPWIIGIGIIVVIGIALIVAVAGSQGSGSGSDITGRKAAPSALVAKTTGIKSSVYQAVGQGSIESSSFPQAISGPEYKVDGKPGIFFLGGEFCPHCAAERWAMLNALSRFGTFSNLHITNSAPTDGDIRTWSFYKVGYKSDYVAFTPVEGSDNSHNPLQTPTSTQSDLASKFDTGGSIPFVYFDGKFVITSATYQYPVLSGKSWDQIAAAMNDPKSAIAQAAIGAANVFTATICVLTNDQPSSACKLPAIQSIETQLKAQKPTSTPTTNGNSSSNG